MTIEDRRSFVLTSIVLLGDLVWTTNSLAVASGSSTNQNIRFRSSRRSFLEKSIAVASTCAAFSGANAQEVPSSVAKPFAPEQALLPATRLRVWIDEAHELSSAMSTSDKVIQYETLVKLNFMLTNPPKLFVSEKLQQRTNRPVAQITTSVSAANKQQYQRNRADLSIPDRVVSMLNQADVERQWGMLQSAEAKREKGNELRAAFNFFTSQLRFDDSYALTASREEKKRMIRNDELPTLSAVIASDLDMRDLHRNQFLTSIEDAKAEVSYQLKQPRESVDVMDVIDLMNQAHTACLKWFDLKYSRRCACCAGCCDE